MIENVFFGMNIEFKIQKVNYANRAYKIMSHINNVD